MKLQIDSTQKIITIQESVNIFEFFEMVKGLFPNDLWKDFTLETNVINNWTNPIIIKEYPVYPVNPYPLNPPFIPSTPIQPPYQPYPWITCTTEATNYNLASGVFNVDFQATRTK